MYHLNQLASNIPVLHVKVYTQSRTQSKTHNPLLSGLILCYQFRCGISLQQPLGWETTCLKKRTTRFWQHVLHFNVNKPVTKDTCLDRPYFCGQSMGRSFKTGSTVWRRRPNLVSFNLKFHETCLSVKTFCVQRNTSISHRGCIIFKIFNFVYMSDITTGHMRVFR